MVRYYGSLLHGHRQIHTRVKRAGDLVGARYCEGYVLRRVGGVDGEATELQRLWALCGGVAIAIAPQTDDMHRTDTGGVSEMHRLPRLDGDARRAEIRPRHTHLVRSRCALPAGGEREQ